MVELELAGPSSVAQANVLALPSEDHATDWWADLVQNESTVAASKQSMALELAAPEWPIMSSAADCSTPTDADQATNWAAYCC